MYFAPIYINMEREELLKNKILELLLIYAADDSTREIQAVEVSEKSILMNHLYEDLGFENRTQMNQFMTKHFPKLAENKPKDILWKKYLFNLIEEMAPSCYECKDVASCFKCII